MNTKFSFVLLIIVTAFIATACAPVIVDNSAPIIQAVQPANNEASALMPVTGESASNAVRAPEEPQLWSGEISLSDNNNPDYSVNAQTDADQKLQTGCISEDRLNRRQGGCVE